DTSKPDSCSSLPRMAGAGEGGPSAASQSIAYSLLFIFYGGSVLLRIPWRRFDLVSCSLLRRALDPTGRQHTRKHAVHKQAKLLLIHYSPVEYILVPCPAPGGLEQVCLPNPSASHVRGARSALPWYSTLGVLVVVFGAWKSTGGAASALDGARVH